MENEVLLATSDGFYYEGVPSTSSIKTTETTSLESAMMYTNSTNDASVATRNIVQNINAGVGIVRIILIILALIFIIKGSLNIVKNKNIKIDNIKTNEESIDLRKEVNAGKKAVIAYYVSAVILIAFVEILKIAIS